jgi:hypothetical protein
MFKAIYFYLDFPLIPAVLRWLAYVMLPTQAWSYDSPKFGYVGGVDTMFGTVAYEDEQGKLVFAW